MQPKSSLVNSADSAGPKISAGQSSQLNKIINFNIQSNYRQNLILKLSAGQKAKSVVSKKKYKNYGYIRTQQLIKHKQEQQLKEGSEEHINVNVSGNQSNANGNENTSNLQIVPAFRNLSLQNLVGKSESGKKVVE